MVEYRFRPPTGRPEDRGASSPRYRREDSGGMIIERDVPVPVRDGITVYADVFRPAAGGPAPPLIAWSPYGKHAGSQVTERYPDSGVEPGQLSPYTAFESPDPVWWTARGYAVVNADIPGTWNSGGDATFLCPREATYGYDLVEWAATQPWSNGRAGMSGVSYLASAQWFIAALGPPHLAAINPWEGWSDTYREVARHGGIPETNFWPYICQRWGYGRNQVEDLAAESTARPLFDEFWASKAALGWLRASHRELDPERSTPWLPVLAHQREHKPGRDNPVPLDIEILPSGTRFAAGETLRLVIQGRDIYRQPRPLVQAFHDDTVNRGRHVIHAGGRYDSYLQVPRAGLRSPV